MDEKEIIKKIKKGDTNAFREIIQTYKRVVYNHSYTYLRNQQDAEDATQEIFLNVYNNIKSFRGESKISTWIYRITVNVCKNKIKQLQRQRAPIMDDIYPGDEEINKQLEIKDKEEKKPDSILITNEKRKMIYKRISELTSEQKNILIMRDINALSYEDISKIMKLSVSAVKSKLFRARDNLRDMLKKDEIF